MAHEGHPSCFHFHFHFHSKRTMRMNGRIAPTSDDGAVRYDGCLEGKVLGLFFLRSLGHRASALEAVNFYFTLFKRSFRCIVRRHPPSIDGRAP